MTSTIAVFGGTGYAGANIVREASSRGHVVTSYTRNPPAEAPGSVTYEQGTVYDEGLVDKVAAASDVIVLAVRGFDDQGRGLIDGMPALAAAAVAHDTRILVVGGAGSLHVSEGGPRLVDTDAVPEAAKPEVMVQVRVLEWLRSNGGELDWVYVSPSLVFGAHAPGETTGAYRTGEISGTDFALAVVDEIEQRNHVRKRFTVGH